MFESVDHVVVSVPEMQAAIAQYETILGTPVSRTGEPPGMGFTNAYFDFAGNSIELVCPTNDDGPVAKHVARTGGGMYLMSLRVDDMEATVADLRAKGVRLIGHHETRARASPCRTPCSSTPSRPPASSSRSPRARTPTNNART